MSCVYVGGKLPARVAAEEVLAMFREQGEVQDFTVGSSGGHAYG